MHADPIVVVLDTVQQVVRELHPQDERAVSPTLDSTLERDLGLDSLGRAELLTRLERTCGVHLPEHLLATADTVRDLLRAVQGATAPASPLGLPEVRRTMPDVAAAPPQHAGTLVEVLEWHVHTHPHRLHITLSDTAEEITYAALYAGAQAVAAGLQARDLQPGHAVAIMLPTCRHFFEGFYGILLAGGIPVPLYPPLRPHSSLTICVARRVSCRMPVRPCSSPTRLCNPSPASSAPRWKRYGVSSPSQTWSPRPAPPRGPSSSPRTSRWCNTPLAVRAHPRA